MQLFNTQKSSKRLGLLKKCLGSSYGFDGDLTMSPIPANNAVGEGEQGVVSATTDVFARVELGAALTHDDAAGCYKFAAVSFDA